MLIRHVVNLPLPNSFTAYNLKYMATSNFLSPEQLLNRRTPIDWRDAVKESPVQTNTKIRKANELAHQGVAAVLFTAQEVNHRVQELAIIEHVLRNGSMDETVYAAILKGGVQFTVPFIREIALLSPRMNPKVDYIQATRYGKSQQGGEVQLVRKLDPKTDISGKLLMLTDDVTDEGLTLEGIRKIALNPDLCNQLGIGVTGPAIDVGAVVLGDKQIAEYAGFNPDLLLQGFWLPNAWAGGMGLDGPDEAMRWLPELVLTTTQDEKYRDSLPEILDILGERAIIGFKDFKWVDKT